MVGREMYSIKATQLFRVGAILEIFNEWMHIHEQMAAHYRSQIRNAGSDGEILALIDGLGSASNTTGATYGLNCQTKLPVAMQNNTNGRKAEVRDTLSLSHRVTKGCRRSPTPPSTPRYRAKPPTRSSRRIMLGVNSITRTQRT